jgi:argininosuccinate lyase
MRKLWGGRFSEATDMLTELLNNSLAFDVRLWRHDIQGSVAHAGMLAECGIITREEAQIITEGLAAIRAGVSSGDIEIPSDAEDIHTAIEGLLFEKIGPVAGKLHTARSRNDQVATDIRLYLRECCDEISRNLKSLQSTLITLAEQEMGVTLPGCTHLQHAQPVLLSHHLLAYFWMLDRDNERIHDCRKRINRSPLGSGALAGTGFPIDRQLTASKLHFESVLPNSMDGVADRDFAVEFLSACAIIGMHLSRFAEEIILWNTPEYRFIDLHDSVTTGSSIMPQKKNPDVAELVRGKAGRVTGNLVTMLMVLKGLPLAYNKDLQEDKEPLFDTYDTLSLVLPAMNKMLSTARFDTQRMQEATHGDFSTATDLADLLVRCGLTFREAHDAVGAIVQHCIANGLVLESLDEAALLEAAPQLGSNAAAAVDVLRVANSVASRTSQGGTAPEAVNQQIALARQQLDIQK